MRKVTENATMAFLANETFKQGNTEVILEDGNASLYLHGNKIAENSERCVYISDAGWQTRTTKERLNGILETIGAEKIYQKGGIWYHEDVEFAPKKVSKRG